MFERSNQTAEIALRYYIATLEDNKLWPIVLPRISASLNNFTKYSLTSLASTQIIYGFKTREALDLLRIEDPDVDSRADDISANTPTVIAYSITRSAGGNDAAALISLTNYRSSHIDAKNAITFASLRIKEYYDNYHQSKVPQDRRSCQSTSTQKLQGPAIKFKKLSPQLIESFPVIERIKRLVYRLRLLSIMLIHDVISVAHLEPATDSAKDSYRRRRLSMLAIVVDEEDEYEIEKLLQKRRIRRGRDWSTQYLVR